MKPLLLAPLLALTVGLAGPAAHAQSRPVVKTKVKPAAGPSVKAKGPRPAAPAPAFDETLVADPAVVDAKANGLTTNMQRNLGLSPQQTEKVRVINRRAVEQVETSFLRYKTDPRKLSGIVESAGSSRLSAIKDVLTPAQFAKYQAEREKKMGIPNVQGVQGNPAPGLSSGGGDQ